MKLGYTCQPQFRVTQHERDLIILKRIIESMGCGTIVRPPQDRDRYNISVANISDLTAGGSEEFYFFLYVVYYATIKKNKAS
jgi:hypothetical protein